MTPSHPLFAESDDDGWIDISIVDQEVKDRELASLIMRDRDRVFEATIDVLKHFLRIPIPADISERIRDHYVSIREDKSRGYYSYLELDLEDDRSSSDSWWVIIACLQPFHRAFEKPQYSVWRFGWECQ